MQYGTLTSERALSRPESCTKKSGFFPMSKAQFDQIGVSHPYVLDEDCRPSSDQGSWPAEIASLSWLSVVGGILLQASEQ